MAFLMAGDLSPEGFLTLVKNHKWPEKALIMAFSPSQATFQFYQYDELLLTAADEGRIFSPDGELKWRRIGLKKRTVYLGNTPTRVELEDYSDELHDLKYDFCEYYLWGLRTDLEAEWIELQIPHRFQYPIKSETYSQGRVALIVENWLDNAGQARFGRYHHIAEIPGERNAKR